MKSIFLVMFIFSLISCTSTKGNKDLFNNYNTYVYEINKNNSKFILSRISSQRANQIKLLGEAQFPILTEFPGILLKIQDHYQVIEKNKGCLTINGYGVNNKPIILSIKYLYENSAWLIDFIEIYYADSENEFQTKGICPSES